MKSGLPERHSVIRMAGEKEAAGSSFTSATSASFIIRGGEEYLLPT